MHRILRATALAGSMALIASTALAAPNPEQTQPDASANWQQRQGGQGGSDSEGAQGRQSQGSNAAARMGAPQGFNQQDQNESNWQQQQQQFQRQIFSRQQQGSQQQATASNIQFDSQVQLERGLSASDRKAVAQAAGLLLMHVNNAREAIDNNSTDSASQHVDKALTLARIIEENAPVYRVETSISSGNNQYQSSDRIHSSIVPVYTELERWTLLGPIAKAKSQGTSESKEQSGVQQVDNPVVQSVQLSSASVELDAAFARRALQKAKEELQSDSPENADQALGSIQRGVYLSYAAANMPLVKAHENLVLARAYATQGQTQEAQATLQAAKNALEVYQRDAGPSRSKDVESVKREIDQLTNSVQKSGGQVAQRLESVEERVTSWIS